MYIGKASAGNVHGSNPYWYWLDELPVLAELTGKKLLIHESRK